MTGKYQVCPTCHGEGTIVARFASVWTAQDRYDDPDGFKEMLSGGYDTTCDECHGKRVVTLADCERFREEREEHFTMLREQGIGPGHPDYY